MVRFCYRHFGPVALTLIESDKYSESQPIVGESQLNVRRRREIPAYALSVSVPGGTTTSHTVKSLTPYTNYNFAITAYNSGGEGPASDEAFAATYEDSKL